MNKKILMAWIVFVTLLSSTNLYAGVKKKKKSSSKNVSSKIYKKKYKKRKHYGNGPDLKKITSEENFKAFDDKPMNGINSIENDSKQQGLK